MRKSSLICLLFIFFATLSAQVNLKNESVKLDIGNDGVIQSLSMNKLSSDAEPIQFRNDDFRGPALVFEGDILKLSHVSDCKFTGKSQDLAYEVNYILEDGRLGIEVSCTNISRVALDDVQLSLRLGLSTEMKHYPEWREEFFPTLMRCEKTHFWGYLMTPNGRVLTLSSPDAIASYRLHYNNSKKIFSHGHLIRTVSLDLLNPGPLPERHNQHMSSIKPNETKKWVVYLEEVDGLQGVLPTIVKNTQAAGIEADLYTIGVGEETKLTIYSSSNPSITVLTPNDKKQKVKSERVSEGQYAVSFRPTMKGVHTFYVTDTKSKKVSEAKISAIGNPYSDYIKSARRAAIKYPQQASSHTESWYGFFSGYIAKEKFPDAEWDKQLDEKFNELYPLMYDTVTNIPTYFMTRIQNHALMAALFAQRYKASGDIEELRKAADLADYIMAMQSPDGAYRNGKTHYTSVIYIAKALMEVMAEEKKLMDDSEEWRRNYTRHYHSVKRAIDELTKNLDNIQTEGEMTFEDGMISCSYTQISQFALLQAEGSAERKRYTAAAEKMLELHRCLSQLVVPDSRMNGGSMRYWEAQYDILTSPNMMNSPHGWSGWRIYGLKNLYELTGKYEYLRQMLNAIGSCIQLLDPDSDKLNWAFIVDPYIEADLFVEDKNNPGKGIYEKRVIGEQYMPMISDWNKPKPNTLVTGYWGYDGGKCDNDVHEIFKCLGEILLSNAYVIEMEDGSFEAYNCMVSKTNGGITVIPKEDVVTNLHCNIKKPLVLTFRDDSKGITNTLGWF